MRIQFWLCEEWFQRQTSPLIFTELSSGSIFFAAIDGLWNRQFCVLAKARAICRIRSQSQGNRREEWHPGNEMILDDSGLIWFVSRGKLTFGGNKHLIPRFQARLKLFSLPSLIFPDATMRLRTGLVVPWNPIWVWPHSLVCNAVANNWTIMSRHLVWAWQMHGLRVVTCCYVLLRVENEEVLRDRQCLSWSATSGLFISGVYEPGCSLSHYVYRFSCVNMCKWS